MKSVIKHGQTLHASKKKYATVNQSSAKHYLCISQLEGKRIIWLEDIIQLEACNNYTVFHLKQARKVIASNTLKVFEPLLQTNMFVRIHRSYMINLRHLTAFTRNGGNYVRLSNDSHLPIARRRLKQFLTIIEQYALGVHE